MREESGIQPIDERNLWCEQIITDRKHGQIKVLIPLDSDLSPDPGRKQRFFSTIIINTPRGALQHEFEIEAENLREALERYPAAANQAGEDFIAGMKDAELRNSLLGVNKPNAHAAN